ncbi:Biogenesis of lysosome-related organelles complex 1 subunit 2 [Smittium mucronatum]|uniref:Biogenesis of lysosome-related organelles complex 1 subunit 2 n=1 Tax=Smittium mucronatum TaxID=133383 RepID=A0A1R0H3Z2_9FUNG|nr:Biogenesis of lysosome-related organelles complex 1 subunit 2 [Smittium mucronatum]
MDKKNEESNASIRNSSKQAFEKLQNYLLAEINSSGEDLLLLENLNLAAKAGFDKLSVQTQTSLAQSTKIQQTYKQIDLYLDQTEHITDQVADLEVLVGELDEYSKVLEAKFSRIGSDLKQLESELISLKTEHDNLRVKWGGSIDEAKTLVKDHIETLHLYNETKDAAQIVLGKLAEMQNKTIKELHADFNISPSD